jgi:hypothetical protein
MGPIHAASTKTVNPIAKPANPEGARLSSPEPKITNIKINVSTVSNARSKNITLKTQKYLKACNFLTKPERVWLEWEINSFLLKK